MSGDLQSKFAEVADILVAFKLQPRIFDSENWHGQVHIRALIAQARRASRIELWDRYPRLLNEISRKNIINRI